MLKPIQVWLTCPIWCHLFQFSNFQYYFDFILKSKGKCQHASLQILLTVNVILLKYFLNDIKIGFTLQTPSTLQRNKHIQKKIKSTQVKEWLNSFIWYSVARGDKACNDSVQFCTFHTHSSSSRSNSSIEWPLTLKGECDQDWTKLEWLAYT